MDVLQKLLEKFLNREEDGEKLKIILFGIIMKKDFMMLFLI